MSTALALALLLTAPPDPAAGETPPSDAPAPSVEPPAPSVEPPAPQLEPTGPAPTSSVEPASDPGVAPAPSRPAGDGSAPVASASEDGSSGEVEPEEPEDPDRYEPRGFEDMPLAPTAARKSATRRNNDVLVRPFSRPVYTIAASGRFVTLLNDGAQIVQPFGYGFAAQLRIHFAAVAKSRFGVEIHAGHMRVQKRREFDVLEDPEGASITRRLMLTDTDFSAGPSMQIPIGPLFVQFGGSAGVALSTLFRPQSAQGDDDEAVTSTNFMLRGGASLGIPVLNRHGLTIGAAVHHIFSPREVALDLTDADSETVRPFGTWLEVLLGYQIWF